MLTYIVLSIAAVTIVAFALQYQGYFRYTKEKNKPLLCEAHNAAEGVAVNPLASAARQGSSVS